MEANANEKAYLSVSGAPESGSGHRQLRAAAGAGKKAPRPPKNAGVCPKSSPSPSPVRGGLRNKPPAPNSGVRVSGLSKAGAGIIKTARARWRHQEKTGGSPPPSAIDQRHPPKPSFGGETRDSPAPPPLWPQAKPRNCRRIVVLGAPKVGKSNILLRFLGKDFERNHVPTDEDFHRKVYRIRGEVYQVDLLDAAREREFPAKRRLSILTGDIFLLAFSLDDRDSFREMRNLRAEVKSSKTKLMKLKDSSRVPIVICGNKADVGAGRVVSRAEVSEGLGEGAAYFETSAKDATGLEEMFRALVSLGGLPEEVQPTQHQTLSMPTYQSLCTDQRDHGIRTRDRRETRGPGLAVCPLARRPSFNSDLRLVLGSSTRQSKPGKCQIQ